jgi:hypothetical protein
MGGGASEVAKQVTTYAGPPIRRRRCLMISILTMHSLTQIGRCPRHLLTCGLPQRAWNPQHGYSTPLHKLRRNSQFALDLD